jgi:hypothetical protein
MKKFYTLLSFILLCTPLTFVKAQENISFPALKAEYVVVERMLVKEGQKEWFEVFWKDTILPVFAKYDGFQGAFMLANNPPDGAKPDETDFGDLLPLGPPEKAFLPHGGIHLNNIQTDTQINFDSVLRGTYNYQVIHFWRDSESLKSLVPELENAWKKVHGEGDPWVILTKDYFTKLENHWDIVYRVVN